MPRSATILILLLCPATQARTLRVDDAVAGFAAIQAAIDQANHGDTVVISPGVYLNHDDRAIHLGTKALRIESLDPNDPKVVADTVIDGSAPNVDPNSIFILSQGGAGDTVLAGLTIANGHTRPAVDCNGVNLTISNCIIQENLAGGVYSSNGNLLLENCRFQGNRAMLGGGIRIHWGKAQLKSCAFLNNQAESEGGAIKVMGWLECVHCSFVGNTATDARHGQGGAIQMFYELATFRHCIFKDNRASEGGAICLTGGLLKLAYCSLVGNQGELGGAVYNDEHGNNEYQSCLFAGNQAYAYGGALFLGEDTKTSLSNCTVAANRAGQEGGGLCLGKYSEMDLTNCIVAHNTDSLGFRRSIIVTEMTGRRNQGALNVFARSAQALEEIATASYCCFQLDPNEDVGPFANGEGIIHDDPLFVRLPDQGGDSWGDDPCTADVDEGRNDDFGDLRLQRSSPCVNTGRPQLWLRPNEVDLDGLPRVLGRHVDMGAYEYPIPSVVVTSPRESETWASGSTRQITWNSKAWDGTVNVLLNTHETQDWQALARDIPNDEVFTWSIPPDLDSSQCRIRVEPSTDDVDTYTVGSKSFAIHPSSTGADTESPWPSLGGNFQRTGLSPFPGPHDLELAWVFDTNAPVLTNICLGFDDRVHIACADGALFTLNNQGQELWRYRADTALLSAPTVGYDGTIYVGSEKGRLYALDVNGILRWTFDTQGLIYSSPAVSREGRVFVGSQDGTLTALTPEGTKLWTFVTQGTRSLPGSILASPALGLDGTVYIGGFYDSTLHALDPNTGRIRWSCSFKRTDSPHNEGPWPFASPVVGSDGVVYQALLHDTHLYAVHPDNGEILWAVDTASACSGFVSDSGWSEPALGPDGTIYVSSDDPWLRAVDPQGHIKWTLCLGESGGLTLAVDEMGMIYAASDAGKLYIIDAAGTPISQFTGKGALSFPVISANGQLIVGDAGNRVWALRQIR